jgi:hypothetical protein
MFPIKESSFTSTKFVTNKTAIMDMTPLQQKWMENTPPAVPIMLELHNRTIDKETRPETYISRAFDQAIRMQ